VCSGGVLPEKSKSLHKSNWAYSELFALRFSLIVAVCLALGSLPHAGADCEPDVREGTTPDCTLLLSLLPAGMVVGTFDGRVGSGDLGVARDLLVGDDLNVRDSAFVGDNLRVRGRLSVRDKITTDSIISKLMEKHQGRCKPFASVSASEIELREPEPGSRAPVMRAGGNIVVGDDSFQAEEVPRSARTNSVVVQNFVVADRKLTTRQKALKVPPYLHTRSVLALRRNACGRRGNIPNAFRGYQCR